MGKKNKSALVSRRNFLKGMGSGVVSTYVISPGISKAAGKILDRTKNISENSQTLSVTINSKKYKLLVEPRTTLEELIRDELNLTGTKLVCNHGECGGCTVLLDGKAVYACHMLALDAAGKEVITIEGLLSDKKLHTVQKAFVEEDGLQCGFCTPGQIVAAHALLLKYPKPTKEQIKEGMSGNLCRCSAYPNILKSVEAAAEKN